MIDALDDDLGEELRQVTEPFVPVEGEDPLTDLELRIAYTQLVGWLEGLFQGIQTAMMAQQMVERGEAGGEGQPVLIAQIPQIAHIANAISAASGTADPDTASDKGKSTSSGMYL
jgi:hypothetical protein